MTFCLRRREFIAGLGGAAVAWPLAVSAQQQTKPIIGGLDTRPGGTGDGLLTRFVAGWPRSAF
jgi:hypothetical protein